MMPRYDFLVRRRWMVAVWMCFLARLLFYSAMLPLWEGYDEWAHFAVVRRMAVNGELLPSTGAPVPRDVEASFELAPVPWEMRDLAPPFRTEDMYWRLDEADRQRLRRALDGMPAEWSRQDGSGAFPAYEALQAPLYYWMMAPVLWLCMRLGAGLVTQVLVLRMLGSVLASITVPLVFLLAREVWPRASPKGAVLGCAAIVALMPGLALDVARVGNDCLAVMLFTMLTWLLVRLAQARDGAPWHLPRLGLAAGVVLGLGLLTKAYFLAAIPVALALLVYGGRGALGLLAGLVLPSWWYLRNWRMTGTISGLAEAVSLRGTGVGAMLRAAREIPWLKAIDSILLSHLYFGGWSSLTVRSWIYHAFYAAVAIAALGVVRSLRARPVLTIFAIYAGFWLAQAYNVVLLYMSKGLEGSMGWYLYAVVGAEVILCVEGWRRWLPRKAFRWIAPAAAAMFALLDLYTVHAVEIPYYTGMIRHRVNGTLEALHAATFQSGGWQRLMMMPPAVLLVLWLLYLAGTVGAVVLAGARECDSAAERG